MGGGSYSYDSRVSRATSSGYYTKSAREIFSSRSINSEMNPMGVGIRESRDSEEHPNSVPIIIALDVTGSMGSVPHFLVKDGLPMLMQKIIDAGIKDPQVLFLGVGDHECDEAPIQIGQFESSDELLDHWLTKTYIEGGGGGNAGESYLLAWYVGGYHTSIDSFEKRGKKGILITIGDEPTLDSVPGRTLKSLFGDGQYSASYSATELLDKAREMYDCYHLHICQTGAGQRERTKDGWRQLMGDGLVLVQRKEDVADTIANIVIESYGDGAVSTAATKNNASKASDADSKSSDEDDWD